MNNGVHTDEYKSKTFKLDVEYLEQDGSKVNAIVRIGSAIRIRDIFVAIGDMINDERDPKSYDFELLERKKSRCNRRLIEYEKWSFILNYD